MPTHPTALAVAAMLLSAEYGGGSASAVADLRPAALRAAANRTKNRGESLGSGGSACSAQADCGALYYCDDTHACYACSYLSDPKTKCDAVGGHCCSAGFLRQCPSNPMKCVTCDDVLNKTCGGQCRDMQCTFKCVSCAGEHQQALHEAGCDNDAIAAWCAGAGPTPPPINPVPIHTIDVGSQVLALALNATDGKLYSGSLDNTIKVWSLEAGDFGRNIMTLSGHTDYVNALAIYDSKLYSGSVDNTIKVWSLEAGDFGRNITTLSGHTNVVFALTIYDSKLYSGSGDKTIKVWSLEAGDFGREIMTLSGHTNDVNALAIHDSKLYSGSWDTTIKVWSLEAGGFGREIATLSGHTSGVYALLPSKHSVSDRHITYSPETWPG